MTGLEELGFFKKKQVRSTLQVWVNGSRGLRVSFFKIGGIGGTWAARIATWPGCSAASVDLPTLRAIEEHLSELEDESGR